MSTPATIVTAAVIVKDGRILITQRPEDVPLPLRWEFPGGKLEPDESPEECLIRELKEEIDITARVDDVVDVGYYSYSHANIVVIFYSCDILGGSPKPLECRKIKWVGPERLKDFDFPPADLKVIEKICN